MSSCSTFICWIRCSRSFIRSKVRVRVRVRVRVLTEPHQVLVGGVMMLVRASGRARVKLGVGVGARVRLGVRVGSD